MRPDPRYVRPFEWHFTEVAGGVVTVVDPRATAFDGHFPGRPVMPGVCLVDMADRAGRAVGLVTDTLLAVERASFLQPVRPGDRLTVSLSRNGATLNAAVRVDGAERCRIRLRYGAPSWS